MVKTCIKSSLLWVRFLLLSIGFFFAEASLAKKDSFFIDYPHCRVRLTKSTSILKVLPRYS